METQETLGELVPLFGAASPEALEWLADLATEQEVAPGEEILTDIAWGEAVYFITSGWVKIQRRQGERDYVLALRGRGDFFGEAAILDETPRATTAIALTPARLLSLSAQRFLQTLLKDPPLQHKLLQLTVKRLRQTQTRLQLRLQPPAMRVAYLLANLAEHYGTPVGDGVEIYAASDREFADLADVGEAEARQTLQKWQDKGWLDAKLAGDGVLCVTNLKQLGHLVANSV